MAVLIGYLHKLYPMQIIKAIGEFLMRWGILKRETARYTNSIHSMITTV